jgi:hypothetical protein
VLRVRVPKRQRAPEVRLKNNTYANCKEKSELENPGTLIHSTNTHPAVTHRATLFYVPGPSGEPEGQKPLLSGVSALGEGTDLQTVTMLSQDGELEGDEGEVSVTLVTECWRGHSSVILGQWPAVWAGDENSSPRLPIAVSVPRHGRLQNPWVFDDRLPQPGAGQEGQGKREQMRVPAGPGWPRNEGRVHQEGPRPPRACGHPQIRFLFFWQYRGLNSGPGLALVGRLCLSSHSSSRFVVVIFQAGSCACFLGPQDLRPPSSWDYRHAPPRPAQSAASFFAEGTHRDEGSRRPQCLICTFVTTSVFLSGVF